MGCQHFPCGSDWATVLLRSLVFLLNTVFTDTGLEEYCHYCRGPVVVPSEVLEYIHEVNDKILLETI